MRLSNSLKFKNSFSKSLKVILEPWAEEYCIEPGEFKIMTGSSSDDNDLQSIILEVEKRIEVDD